MSVILATQEGKSRRLTYSKFMWTTERVQGQPGELTEIVYEEEDLEAGG